MPVEFVLLGWGLVVGLDLVSVGQFMISRPLVAGSVAGAIVGDPVAGATVGMILELFALDVMPVGAVRYPDYGLGAVVATALAAGAPVGMATGVAVLLGLATAVAGELGMQVVRRANAGAMRRRNHQIAAGDGRVIDALHQIGLLRDATRAVVVCGTGLIVARAVKALLLVSAETAAFLGLVLIGCAVGTATAGALRVAGGREQVGWLTAGAVLGLLLAAVV